MRNMYFSKNLFFEAKIKSHNWIFLAKFVIKIRFLRQKLKKNKDLRRKSWIFWQNLT